jgi:hypothetical protein
MKRYILFFVLCSLAMAGCRQQSDEVLSYVYNDNMAFGKADTSYAGKFEVMWRGMSSNYALWDYEYEQGLNWDKVYDEYYPKFKALDEQQNPVTNKQLKALLDEVVEPLHDGHLAIQMKNHQTGNYVTSNPGYMRVLRERGKEHAIVYGKKPILDYYQTSGKLKAYKKWSTTDVDSTYSYAPFLANPLTVTYALFDDNIAYFGFDHFTLLYYVHPDYAAMKFPNADSTALAIITGIRDTWNAWFDAIQEHHAAGDLGGVIIDVRSNGGGLAADFQLVIGALVPSGGLHESNARFKRGTGRLDYSPIMPQTMSTYEEEHVTVTEPIAVLCNCATVSMGEHTSYSAKLLDNGRLIGTRTYGGFSELSTKETYTNNYAGFVGEQYVTSVFCYIPQEVAFTLDNKILEGYGVTPDIEIPFDAATWNKGAGPDNQLDRALQFIRTGN